MKKIVVLDNGWIYAFVFLIILDLFLVLCSFSKNRSIKGWIFFITFFKMYIFLSEINVVIYLIGIIPLFVGIIFDIILILLFISIGFFIFYSYLKNYKLHLYNV